jgi:hypothetical protein
MSLLFIRLYDSDRLLCLVFENKNLQITINLVHVCPVTWSAINRNTF